jgi:hypothetical protein
MAKAHYLVPLSSACGTRYVIKSFRSSGLLDAKIRHSNLHSARTRHELATIQSPAIAAD